MVTTLTGWEGDQEVASCRDIEPKRYVKLELVVRRCHCFCNQINLVICTRGLSRRHWGQALGRFDLAAVVGFALAELRLAHGRIQGIWDAFTGCQVDRAAHMLDLPIR